MKPQKPNCENFDDDLTKVAPKGEFKACNTPIIQNSITTEQELRKKNKCIVCGKEVRRNGKYCSEYCGTKPYRKKPTKEQRKKYNKTYYNKLLKRIRNLEHKIKLQEVFVFNTDKENVKLRKLNWKGDNWEYDK